MSLPTLNWKALPLVTLTSGTINAVIEGIYNAFTSSIYLDGSPRVTGSASAWTIAQEVSGSTIEAVWCIAPTGSFNQRVILAGSSRTGLTPQLASPDTVYAPATLYVSVAKNASTYTSWNNATPFSSGSFFGFWKTWVTSSGTPQIVRCLESQEAIAVFIQNTAANTIFGCIAGAILDPESTDTGIDSETDNRLYGIVTSGVSVAMTMGNNLNASTPMLNHQATTGTNHTGIFTPSSGSIKTISRNAIMNTLDIEELTTRSGRLIKMPIIEKYFTSPINFAGRVREIWAFRDAVMGNTVTDGATVNGYLIGGNTSVASDCFLFSTGSN